MASLIDRAVDAINSDSGWDVLGRLADDCIAAKSSEALVALQKLFTANWEWEPKSIALNGLFAFGLRGLQAVVEGAAANPSYKNRVMCAQALVGIASNSPPSFSVAKFPRYAVHYDALRNDVQLRDDARELLVSYFLSIEDEFEFANTVS